MSETLSLKVRKIESLCDAAEVLIKRQPEKGARLLQSDLDLIRWLLADRQRWINAAVAAAGGPAAVAITEHEKKYYG